MFKRIWLLLLCVLLPIVSLAEGQPNNEYQYDAEKSVVGSIVYDAAQSVGQIVNGDVPEED
ncbi:MAG: hypothetical protein Q4F18_03290, partial [Clostridia bacterium]|nr:hypothetical protein [Clostridia bacterium]